MPPPRADFPLMAERPIQFQPLSPFEELYHCGVRLLHVDATFSENIFHPAMRAWNGPGSFDYTYQETYWRRLLEACPEARFCLRLCAYSPPWWDEAHPEELQQYADGSREAEFQRSDRKTGPSLASEVWRAESLQALEHFLHWLDTSGWGERVWGFLVSYGITWEWGILGTDRFPDYSAPMRRRFQNWLRETYGDERALQEAWGDPLATFGAAPIPSQAARERGDGILREFPRDRPASDFQNCLSDANVGYLLDLGRCVRRVTGRRYVLGTWYGYTLTAREQTPFTGRYGAGGLMGGHHALGRFLDSGVFDFNTSPYCYANRDLGSGALLQHTPRASVRHHGVQVYDENDLRPFTVAGLADDRTISIGQTDTREDSILHQRLALAQALCHGTSYWWTELSDWIGPYRRYFDDPALLSEISRHVQIFDADAGAAARSVAEVALVIDERSLAALDLRSKLFREEVYEQLSAWSWTGAPFDTWLASDATPETMSPYRLIYVFAPYLGSGLRASLKAALSGKVVWWGPASGLLGDRGRDLQGFQALTGFSEPDHQGILHRSRDAAGGALYGPCAGQSPAHLRAILSESAGVSLLTDRPALVMASHRLIAAHTAEKTTLRISGGWREMFSGREGSGPVQIPARDVCLFCLKPRPEGETAWGAGQKSSRNPRRGSIRQPKVAKNELPWVSTGE